MFSLHVFLPCNRKHILIQTIIIIIITFILLRQRKVEI